TRGAGGWPREVGCYLPCRGEEVFNGTAIARAGHRDDIRVDRQRNPRPHRDGILRDPFANALCDSFSGLAVGCTEESHEIIPSVSKEDVRDSEASACVSNNVSKDLVPNTAAMLEIVRFSFSSFDK